MSKKKTAIVLGGTSPHIALIERLQNRGYHTILVDYYENPPAKAVADEHLMESTLDQNKVVEIARQRQAELVISACVDQANVTACYVAEELGLPRPYSYQTALEVSNKGLMKHKMLEHGIPTSRYIYVRNVEEFRNAGFAFPVMVKPADSCGSAGVKQADDLQELGRYLHDAKEISRADSVVIEEVRDGMEVSVYAFVKQKRVHFLMISQRFSVEDGYEKVIKCYSTVAPAVISPVAMDRLQVVSDKIAVAFGLDNTPLHVQAFIKGDDINIIEFAPRVGGGLSYKTIFLNTGFDIIDATIDSYLGIEPKLEYRTPSSFYAVNLLYAKPAVFSHITGFEELLRDGIITDFFPYKTKGMRVSPDKASGSRVGAFIVQASDKGELRHKIATAISTFDVFDTTENSIIRRDIYSDSDGRLFLD